MSDRAQRIKAYVAVGSNIEPEKHIQAALEMLSRRVTVTGISTVYRTPAIGRPDDPDFLNAVWEIETDIPPRELEHQVLEKTERSLGRTQTTDKNAPRTIDLDLILYGDLVIDEHDLRLPHPDIARWFVHGPLLELAPGLRLPGTDRPLENLFDQGETARDSAAAMGDFTAALRETLRKWTANA